MTAPPNIVYLHSHDTGRYVQPYGRQVVTPNIQRLADQGLLFRNAFAAAPSCSPSRAALLTGRWPHCNGMNGLAHRGFALDDPGQHMLHTLRGAGYWTAMVGEQHVSRRPARPRLRRRRRRGHQPRARRRAGRRVADPRAPARAVLPLRGLLRDPPRLLRADLGARRALLRPARRPARHARHAARHGRLQAERAACSTTASARCSGALDEQGLADDTLVVFTTDHGLPFPGAKATLSDRGLGVLLIMRGPGGFHGGRVSDALISQIDIFPTLCDLAGIDRPDASPGPLADPARPR